MLPPLIRSHYNQDNALSSDRIILMRYPSFMCRHLLNWRFRRKSSLYRIEDLFVREDYPQIHLPVEKVCPIEGIVALKDRSDR